MSKNILIVEDHPLQRENLREIIVRLKGQYKVFLAESYEEAMTIALNETIHLFMLDIDLKGDKTGYQLAENLREMSQYQLTWIVFLTVRTDYERSAFKKIHCYDYLVKPYGRKEVDQILETLLQHNHPDTGATSDPYMTLDQDGVVLRVNVDEIVYIEARGRKCVLITTRGPLEVAYIPLKAMETQLAKFPSIMRAHRSYLVNTKYIKCIERENYRSSHITFYNVEDSIPVTSGYKEKIELFLKRE